MYIRLISEENPFMVAINDIKFFARKSSNPRNGTFYSLRLSTQMDGNGTEFARLRMERNGWNAWADDRDFNIERRHAILNLAYRSPVCPAPLPQVLAAMKRVYLERYHEEELLTQRTEEQYEAWIASHGDATGPGQDFDANGVR